MIWGNEKSNFFSKKYILYRGASIKQRYKEVETYYK